MEFGDDATINVTGNKQPAAASSQENFEYWIFAKGL